MSFEIPTLKLRPQNNQEAFDMVIRHLAQQKDRAYRDDEDGRGCVYLTEDGNRCGVGALIKADDRHLQEVLDLEQCAGAPVPDLIVDGILEIGGVSQRLLETIQVLHDQGTRTDGNTGRFTDWDKARSCARQYRLDPSIVDEAERGVLI